MNLHDSSKENNYETGVYFGNSEDDLKKGNFKTKEAVFSEIEKKFGFKK